MSDVLPTETRNAEPCYCRRCKGQKPLPCAYRVRNVWRYLLCVLSLYHFDPAITRDDRCKRCGTQVRS